MEWRMAHHRSGQSRYKQLNFRTAGISVAWLIGGRIVLPPSFLGPGILSLPPFPVLQGFNWQGASSDKR